MRTKFLSMFKWDNSLITGKDRDNIEPTIVEFNDIFARHRIDIEMNTQFKVSLTPKDDKPVYTQSLPEPLNHNDDLTVELLRLLMDLRKINTFISDDYINNNHPISTLSYAASGEKAFLQT